MRFWDSHLYFISPNSLLSLVFCWRLFNSDFGALLQPSTHTGSGPRALIRQFNTIQIKWAARPAEKSWKGRGMKRSRKKIHKFKTTRFSFFFSYKIKKDNKLPQLYFCDIFFVLELKLRLSLSLARLFCSTPEFCGLPRVAHKHSTQLVNFTWTSWFEIARVWLWDANQGERSEEEEEKSRH